MPAVDPSARQSPRRMAAAVDAFVVTHRDAAAAGLRAAYRSSLARLVAKLPEGAAAVRDAAKADLKVCIDAYALAEAALCAAHVRSGDFVSAVQSADAALVVLGLPLGCAVRDAAEAVLLLAREAHEKSPSVVLQSVRPPARPAEWVSRYEPCARRPGRLSVDDFKLCFFDRDRPVVLEAAAAHWPAVELWSKPAFLDRLCGFRVVPVEWSKKGSAGPPREECVPIQRVLEAMHGVGGEAQGSQREVMYLAQHPIFDYMTELRAHIRTPEFVQAGGEKEAKLINVWMGSESSGTRLHFDSSDNFLVQVVGWKRVVLFHPRETPKLHVKNKGDNFSPVDVDNNTGWLYPKFEGAEGLSVVLGPGDILYMPAGYWHWVRAMTPSISVNFWF